MRLTWTSVRQQVASGPATEPKVEDLTATAFGADRRVVTFVQRFGDEAVRKEQTLAREGGIWRIVAERTLVATPSAPDPDRPRGGRPP